MKINHKIGICLGAAAAAGIIGVTGWFLHHHTVAVLQPAGPIGHQERNLMIFCVAISVAIVVPVFGLLASFAWKFREGNKKAAYTPAVGGNRGAELVWWTVPSVLISIISVVTWQSSYALDPYKTIAATKPTLHIQVVALDWKWLFIYPTQQVASVNELTLPVNTPVDFEITSDSVMNSFWIPQLGGQMYAMPGMTTHLNLLASKLGTYTGSSANISGQGFADMAFSVHVIKPDLYPFWSRSMKAGNPPLTPGTYAQLAKPGVVPAGVVHRYTLNDQSLFDSIIMKYMMPMAPTAPGVQS